MCPGSPCSADGHSPHKYYIKTGTQNTIVSPYRRKPSTARNLPLTTGGLPDGQFPGPAVMLIALWLSTAASASTERKQRFPKNYRLA